MKPQFPSTGACIGSYRLVRELGSGAFAKIYEATSIYTQRSYAIKCLPKHADPEYLALQKLEIKWNQRIKNHVCGGHPNIVTFDEVLEDDRYLYMVFEYVSGGDLCDLLGDRWLEAQEVKAIFLQVLEALKYCHMKGVYHRDIKPENILLTEDGVAKICDFGLATDEDVSFDHGIGTTAYMCPEIFDEQSARPYVPAYADMWSLGVLLFTMINRNPCWDEPSIDDPAYCKYYSNRKALKEAFSLTDETVELLMTLWSNIPCDRLSVQELSARFSNINEFWEEQTTAKPAGITINIEPSFSNDTWISRDDDERISSLLFADELSSIGGSCPVTPLNPEFSFSSDMELADSKQWERMSISSNWEWDASPQLPRSAE